MNYLTIDQTNLPLQKNCAFLNLNGNFQNKLISNKLLPQTDHFYQKKTINNNHIPYFGCKNKRNYIINKTQKVSNHRFLGKKREILRTRNNDKYSESNNFALNAIESIQSKHIANSISHKKRNNNSNFILGELKNWEYENNLYLFYNREKFLSSNYLIIEKCKYKKNAFIPSLNFHLK